MHAETNSRRFGYRYQDLIGILRLIDLLNDKADKVYFEKKESQHDRFDDIKMHVGNQLHSYQIKSSYVNNELQIIDFAEKHILDLSQLFISWKELKQEFLGKEILCHIYTTKSISSNNSFKGFVNNAAPVKTTFCENPSDVYHLKSEILDHEHLTEVKNLFVHNAKNNAEIQEFLNALIIETNQPSSPADIPVPIQAQGNLEQVILTKISSLGLSEHPNFFSENNVLSSLFNLVNRDSITPHVITKNDLEKHLRVQRNFGAIKNSIKLDESLYIDTANNLAQLDDQIASNAGSIFGIKGNPGSGKTWLLVKWLQKFRKTHPRIVPIVYYSSISVTEDKDFEVRITQDQLLSNMVNAITTSYSITAATSKYAANIDTFNELLGKLNEIAKRERETIPIVVDGLDHVNRVGERAASIPKEKKTIMDFLNKVTIPERICFVFGTQEGSHLDKLKERFGKDKFYEIEGFDKTHVKSYLEKLKVYNGFITSVNIDIIIQKTSGLPLLVSYLSQQLKSSCDIEKIKRIPVTDGSVKEYYEYLWRDLENGGAPRMLARCFSLLEFSAEVQFLESMCPESLRDGLELDACLDPLLFLLQKNQRDEISIFHDSFREFILVQTNFKNDLQIEYSKRIYDALAKECIFSNARAFRYTIKYALKSKQFDKVAGMVDLKFIDEAMTSLCNREDIRSNLLHAIRAAYEKGDPATILEKSLLKRYTVERYQYLEKHDYKELILQLYPHKISQILVTEDQLNLSLNDTMWFLSEGLSKNIELPYSNMMKIRRDALERTHSDGTVSNDSELIPHYGLLLFHERGIECVISWIAMNCFSLEQIISIFTKILPFSTYDMLQSGDHSLQEYWPAICLFVSLYHNRHTQFQTQFRHLVQDNSIPYFPAFGDFLKRSNTGHNDLIHLIRKVDLSIPDQMSIDVQDLKKYEQQIWLNAYCKNAACLEEYKNEIQQNSTSFFFMIVNLVYQIAVASQKDDSQLTDDDAGELLDALSEFTSYNTETAFNQSRLYSNGVKSYVRSIIKKIIEFIVTQGSFQTKTRLIEVISKIGSKYLFTSLTQDSAYGVVLKHSNELGLKQQILTQISNEIGIGDTQSVVDLCFDRTRLFFQAGDKNTAEQFFKKGIRLTHSYGYHKDFLLYELHETSVLLGGSNYLRRAAKNLDLTEYLDVMTDGDETSSIPSDIIRDTVRMHSGAGYAFAMEYGVDSYRFEESVTNFVESCQLCPVLIRYFLSKTRIVVNRSSYSSSRAFGIRHGLIQECISDGNTALARFFVEDLRIELMRDLPQKTKSMEIRFNRVAEELGLASVGLDLREEAESDQPYEPDQSVDYSYLSPEEAVQLFEQDYGWLQLQPARFSVQLLEMSYFKDRTKTKKLVTKSLLSACIGNDYASLGLIHNFGKYLFLTNQTSKLNQLYQKTEAFLDGLFRDRLLAPQHNFGSLQLRNHDDRSSLYRLRIHCQAVSVTQHGDSKKNVRIYCKLFKIWLTRITWALC